MSPFRGRPARRLALLAFLAAALAAAAGPAAAQEVRYTRPVPVDAPGWVRVPLGPEVLRRTGAGAGLRLFGPEGEDVPFRRVPAEAPEPVPAEEGDEAPPEPGAEVERPAPRSFRLSFEPPDCRARPEEEVAAAAAPARVVCRVPAGSAGRFLRRLCFTAAAGTRAGVRLFGAEEGRWEEVADGVWSPAAGAEPSRCVPLDLTLTDPAAALRLELYGGGAEPPAVREVTVEYQGEDLLFRARRAGRHTLAYGPGVARSARGPGRQAPPAPAGVRPASVTPGPEETAEVPAGGPALPASAGPAPTVAFDETWRVTADAPEPGRLHRLTLPPEVYPVAALDLSDLRLLVSRVPSQLQVPFLHWRPAEPVPAAELRGAVPVPAGAGTSRVEVEPPGPGLPLSALVVSAPAAARPEGTGRRVRVLAVEPGLQEPPVERALSPWLAWDCVPRPPLPCRLTVALEGAGGPRAERLVVEIDDRGEAGPLPAVDVELWRRRDVLLFAWPGSPEGGEGEEPLLAAGAPGLEAPDYQLAERRQELLARPWQEARLVAEGGSQDRGRVGAWTITLALLAAVLALVALLHRILSDSPAP